MFRNTPGVLETTEAVVREAADVTVDHAAVGVLADRVAEGRALSRTPPPWDGDRHFVSENSEDQAMYILVQDALNFCFWGDPPWEVEYRGRVHRGYWALTAALKRALATGCPLLDPSYLANLSPDDLGFILRGLGTLHLMKQRLAILRELGRGLLDLYDGRFLCMVEEARGGAAALVSLMAASFTSFDDRAVYKGMEIRFMKRAQILVADLYGAMGGRDVTDFHDLDQLTAFADYELPRVLRAEGILGYSERLARAVDSRRRLKAGGNQEIEIRACTVWAVEWLRRELAERGVSLMPYQIDWLLWQRSQEAPPAEPPHRVLTYFY